MILKHIGVVDKQAVQMYNWKPDSYYGYSANMNG